MHADILAPIAVAVIAAVVCAFLARWARQPVILGYMAAGILVGPTQGLGWIATQDIEPVSELGLILLLFMIGLEIDLKKLRQAGTTVAAAGVGQFLLTAALGFFFFQWLGFGGGGSGEGGNPLFAPLYLGVATALSSTMIVVKLLHDKRELDTVPGRITLGILVFQDIWAILFLALQPDLHHPQVVVLLVSLAKGAGVVAFALLVSRFVLPVLFRSIATVPELMVIGALAWCFGISTLSAELRLSREMGALIAGIALSTFPYNLDVTAKVISLRDFFITLFFVMLGTKIPRPTPELLVTAVAGSAFLVASRVLTITPILAARRKGNRASVIPAINLAQLSEFSLVICAIGVELGHVDERVLSVVMLMLVLTAVASTYGIMYNHEIFSALNPVLKRLGLRDLDEQFPVAREEASKPIVFLGFSRYASSLLHELLARSPALAEYVGVVDFSPEVREELHRRGITAVYGDISHGGTLRHANIHEARVLLCTIPDSILKGTTNAQLFRQLSAIAPRARIIVTAETFDAARELYEAGAAFVFIPRLMSARDLVETVLAALDGHLDEVSHVARYELRARVEVLP